MSDELGDGLAANDMKSREEVLGELEAVRGRVREIASRMRSGDVRPCPETCAWNGGCSYPSICRIER